MDTLQLRDTFAPYYSAKPRDVQDKARTMRAGQTSSDSDMRERLQLCRDRLADILAAADDKRH